MRTNIEFQPSSVMAVPLVPLRSSSVNPGLLDGRDWRSSRSHCYHLG